MPSDSLTSELTLIESNYLSSNKLELESCLILVFAEKFLSMLLSELEGY